jgi:neutral ceramidase
MPAFSRARHGRQAKTEGQQVRRTLGVNPRGPADRTVPVLRVDGPDGKPRAVLFGAATHNTTLTDQCYEVCGDYAGFAQDHVEEHYPGA